MRLNESVKIWKEQVIIPTYEVGEAEKNPIFLENRVYQGSSGKVYPYPIIEAISDEKMDKAYTAVYMENQYIKIMILPELGGRIQRAYDKTNGYDFVYYNQVIKPALVGLVGPWISGGIEFNWPQHHRPTTFMPVDYILQDNEDGSKTVFVNDVDQMYGTKGIAAFTLYPDSAYIEIRGQLYNRTPLPQSFLWWANPAVAVNDHTQSIFPPDVHAVMDHGKRDVSRFPIATGVYYKKDYSEGVDISRYKNIPVPTSYMAEKSEFDFVGGYDHKLQAGILHVADHHISPGKKQWTWGCGDFGKAWDRNLTDEDGPYIELMTGVFTDNQPDFSWLKPFEEKTFKQYFMPYKGIGAVKNATKNGAINMEITKSEVNIKLYTSKKYDDVEVKLYNKDTVIFEEIIGSSPLSIYEKKITGEFQKESHIKIVVKSKEETIVEYTPVENTLSELPKPAKPAKAPKDIMTNEELYLTGLHLEQYRHATFAPEDYYLEGLKRDDGDIRINNSYGCLILRRGLFGEAESYFRKAIIRLTALNSNPYDGESYYNLGLSLFYQDKRKDAYDAFYKAAWTSEQQEMAYYYLAALDAKERRYDSALELIEKAIIKNVHNMKARSLK
ncbi:MAG: repeat-containing protein, partial [Anaerocolumna sp.]|nr:repeat-containing protein [Anaerocolumna sp.]